VIQLGPNQPHDYSRSARLPPHIKHVGGERRHRAGKLERGNFVDHASVTIDSIDKRERCSIRKVNMAISLAFLAPDLVKAAIEGRLPRGMGVARLVDSPAEWSRQHEMLGLPARTSPKIN